MKRKDRPEYREDALEKTIRLSRAAFYESEKNRSMSRGEFLLSQAKMIRKRWWLLQAAVLAGILLLMVQEYTDDLYSRCLGAAAPLFLLLALPELWKNRHYEAMEVESASYYTLRQVYAARLTLFAGVDLCLISLFFLSASCFARLTLWELLVQFLLPFNVDCCICFLCLYSRNNNSEIISVLLSGVFTLLWETVILSEPVYETITLPVWILLLGLSVIWGVSLVVRGQRRWRYFWEVQSIWN